MTLRINAALAAACACGMLAAVPSHALLITKSVAVGVTVDGSSDTSSVIISNADLGGALNIVKDVNITIVFAKCSGDPTADPCPDPTAANTFGSEIHFALTGPEPGPLGTTVDLVNFGTYPDDSGGSLVSVMFDEELGVGDVGSQPYGTSPVRPDTTLAALYPVTQLGALGTWTLLFEDSAGADPLFVQSFELQVEVCDANDRAAVCQTVANVPAPATALLLALGLAGIGVSRSLRS